MRNRILVACLSTASLLLASCGGASSGGNGGGGGGPIGSTPTPTPPAPTPTPPAPTPTAAPTPSPTPTPRPTPTPTGQVGISATPRATFNEPWAIAFEPGTGRIFVTEKGGTMKFYSPGSGDIGTVTGLPSVAYGGQGGLGDIAFAPDYATTRTIYLSWAEDGGGGTRGAAVGRGALNCGGSTTSCNITGLTVIWRQNPKVSGSNHYSHRLAFSPDGDYLFVTSGERQLGSPAQDLGNNLGKFVRLDLDGSPASGNPFEGMGGVSREIWSYGHRNILGIRFDASGRLWGLEHGPAGGDELNLIKRGLNYGWPNVSNGSNYDGSDIPDHSPTGADGYEPPAISWNPVIAPGDFIFYKGSLFPWRGDAIIAGLKIESLVRVTISGENATEVRRYRMNNRIRDIEEAPDGAIWVIEDGGGGRLLRLTPN